MKKLLVIGITLFIVAQVFLGAAASSIYFEDWSPTGVSIISGAQWQGETLVFTNGSVSIVPAPFQDKAEVWMTGTGNLTIMGKTGGAGLGSCDLSLNGGWAKCDLDLVDGHTVTSIVVTSQDAAVSDAVVADGWLPPEPTETPQPTASPTPSPTPPTPSPTPSPTAAPPTPEPTAEFVVHLPIVVR